MCYPLAEKIGNPALLVGQEKEFRLFDKLACYLRKSTFGWKRKNSFIPLKTK